MSKTATALAVSLLFALPRVARAEPEVDAARVRDAAGHFETGALAYQRGAFEEAASAFEAADAVVPSNKPLKLAIKARDQAGQGSRAATLSELALARYPSDAEIVDVAKRTIEKLSPLLARVSVACASPCVLAVGTRAIPGRAAKRWTVYLDPGHAIVSASFQGSLGSTKAAIDVLAGKSTELRFEPAEASVASTVEALATPKAALPVESAPAVEPSTVADKEVALAEASPPRLAGDDPPSEPSASASGTGFPRSVFFTSLAVTTLVGGVTAWSGIDTLNHPGADAVRKACAGKGPSCPEYQDGLARQGRTNVLIGATAGAAVVTTFIGVVFTRWSAPEATSSALVPVLDFDRSLAGAALRGRF
jgi:hypothetical protein